MKFYACSNGKKPDVTMCKMVSCKIRKTCGAKGRKNKDQKDVELQTLTQP